MTQATQTVLILAARSDIARALAHVYASHGFNLQLAARNAQALHSDAEDLRIRYTIEVTLHDWDAVDFSSHEHFYNNLQSKPHGVICVAGLLGNQSSAQHIWSEAQAILEVNYMGLVSQLNAIANDFEQRGNGFIIGISSVAGDRGRQSNYLYGSAKAGFTAYLSGLRNRLSKRSVQVLTVKPGFVQTSMTQDMDLPAALTASPEKVAQVVFKAQQRGKDQIYTLGIWRYIMLVIRHIPEVIFKRLSL
jgi:short-subunit dehydrogenase